MFSLILIAALGFQADDEAARTKEGLEAFQSFLKKTYPEKKWQQGPSRLDSPALKAAYPGQRLYFVYSTPPLPPGANIKSIQDAHSRHVEDILANYISAAVRVDQNGSVVALLAPKDFNAGLVKVTGNDDARTAAAAILSLRHCNQIRPTAVDTKDIAVTKSENGWTCQYTGKIPFRGSVIFNAEGQCTAITKGYSGPLPP